MPSYPCRWPTCSAYVPRRGDYCEAHREHGRRERKARDTYYDQHLRDPDARRFYNSAAWQRARGIRLREHPTCERCGRAWSRHVHHRKPLKDCELAEKLDQGNLMAVCPPCHNQLEKEAAAC